MVHPLQDAQERLFPGSTPFLEAVEKRLDQELSPEGEGRRSPLLADASRHLCLSKGAKRLRPQFAQFLGTRLELDAEKVERIAVAAELIHAASLLHDDVVDGAKERRGRPSANFRWGNPTAVLAGDWVLTRAFSLLSTSSPLTFQLAVETLSEMTWSAIREVEATGKVDLTVPEWREIAEGKTGALFSWCGQAVAIEAGRGDLRPAIETFGRHLGVAFQMADDLADMINPALGKDQGSDLRNHRPGFPLVLAAESQPALRLAVAAAWSWPTTPAGELQALSERIATPALISEVTRRLEEEVALAGAAICQLAPDDPDEGASRLARMFLSTLLPPS